MSTPAVSITRAGNPPCQNSQYERVLAWQVSEAMSNQGLNKSQMAEQMMTSRTSLDRLLYILELLAATWLAQNYGRY